MRSFILALILTLVTLPAFAQRRGGSHPRSSGHVVSRSAPYVGHAIPRAYPRPFAPGYRYRPYGYVRVPYFVPYYVWRPAFGYWVVVYPYCDVYPYDVPCEYPAPDYVPPVQ